MGAKYLTAWRSMPKQEFLSSRLASASACHVAHLLLLLLLLLLRVWHGRLRLTGCA